LDACECRDGMPEPFRNRTSEIEAPVSSLRHSGLWEGPARVFSSHSRSAAQYASVRWLSAFSAATVLASGATLTVPYGAVAGG
jgi:hypothetical protein